MTRFRLLLLSALILMLTACAAGPGIPDTVYFRLPPREATPTVRIEPLSLRPVVVETLLADGLHSDQALIYSLDADGARLKGYHYQLWVDPPVRMLQRRLIGTLRDAKVSDVVADRIPNQVDALRIEGRLERFERIRVSENEWKVAAAVALRVDLRDGKPPLLLREYVQELPAAGPSVRDSVNALGAAIDRIYAEFQRDLEAAIERG
jgi:cholesterol transport system auxiliary component